VSPRLKDTSWSASASESAGLTDRLATAIATGAGVGYAPMAPGTVASAITAVGLWVAPFSRVGLVAFFVVVTVAGVWASGRVERIVAGKDPGIVIIDEIAGMTLAVLALPLTPLVLGSAFLLFRLFDIVKPFPANRSQALPGGLGVMIDDLIAGGYALLCLVAARGLFGLPA
jgi:phosphatidylglycerophosphatase A